MLSDEKLQEKVLQLSFENKQLERFKYLNELILSGLNAILSSDKHDEIFQKLFAVIHEVVSCEDIVLLALNEDSGAMELVRSSQQAFNPSALPLEAFAILTEGTHNFFSVAKLPFWQPYFAQDFPQINAMLTHAFRTHQTHYVMLLLAQKIGAFGPQIQELLSSFTSFVANTLTQVETRKLIQERDQLLQRQKRIEASLLQQEKMASLGQLAAGVAHELNNPLGFIYSNLNTMQAYLADFEKALRTQPLSLAELGQQCQLDLDYLLTDAKDLIQESLEGARRARDIINNLRGYSHPDDKNTGLENINTLIESAVKIIKTQIKYNSVVNLELATDLPKVLVNANQINQVLINLLNNANQAVEPGKGQITLCSGTVDDQVYFDIADNGCGIPQEAQAKIFDPFFTTKDVGQGTGLGLSLCKAIIEQHSGAITLQKSDSSGTLFRVSLPIAAR